MTYWENIISKYKTDIFLISILFLTLPLFFYKLGQSSLVSWDEAWYAEIARNIINNGEILTLTFNGRPFYDHPPAGFWSIAGSFYLFGISEFTARLAPAVCGFLTVIFTYFLGKKLFNTTVGFLAAICLTSSLWFLYRARSGNLDVILTFLFVVTFYLALKVLDDRRFLIPFSLSLSLLFLTKTMVPFTILPALFLIFLTQKNLSFKKPVLFLNKIYQNLIPILIFIILIGGWWMTNSKKFPDFGGHYFMIGLPGFNTETNFINNLTLIKEYLHNSIGKWFWPAILSLIVSPFLLQRRFLYLSIFCLTFLIPFTFSPKGQIWHLVPIHPFMLIAMFGFGFVFLEKVFKNNLILTSAIITVFGFYIYSVQIKQVWYQFIDIPAYVSDEAILSKESSNFSSKLFIDGDFLPAAVFYSGKQVSQISRSEMNDLFKKDDFLLITYLWRLDETNIPKDSYKIIKSDRDKVLIKKI